MVGWSVSVLGGPSINNLLRAWNQLKWSKGGNRNSRFTKAQVQTDTWYQWISVSFWNIFILKYFLQNLKNSLVAKRTIYDRTLGRPVDSWVAVGDRATVFQQHWNWTAVMGRCCLAVFTEHYTMQCQNRVSTPVPDVSSQIVKLPTPVALQWWAVFVRSAGANPFLTDRSWQNTFVPCSPFY